MSRVLDTIKSLAGQLELLEYISNKLAGVRLVEESDRTTFDRVLKIAQSTICKNCRGTGNAWGGNRGCPECNDSGVRQFADTDAEAKARARTQQFLLRFVERMRVNEDGCVTTYCAVCEEEVTRCNADIGWSGHSCGCWLGDLISK